MGKHAEKPIPLHISPKRRWHILSFIASLLKVTTKESQDVVCEHKKVVLHGLPLSFEGFRILHLSDLHIKEISAKEKKLITILSGLSADLAVITGDFTYRYGEYEDTAINYMREVVGSLKHKCNIVAVRGNSDSPVLMDKLEEIGITILQNESFELYRDKDSICIGGVDDPHHRMDDIDLAFHCAPDASFKILLAHSPDVVLRMKEQKVDLLLSGHTHGGQVRIPWIGPLMTKTEVGKRFSSGLVNEKGVSVHISRGFGGIPIRYRCTPEIALLELARG